MLYIHQRYYNTDIKRFINQDILSGSVTGETGLKEVKQTFENETETLVHVTVSNENDKETIDTTVRHPFYVVGYGFRYASELRVGYKVLSVSGDIYEVTSVEIEDLDEPVKIYNFEVEDWHTYFVSESGILVHNTTGGQPCGAEVKTSDENNDNTTSKSERKQNLADYYEYKNVVIAVI